MKSKKPVLQAPRVPRARRGTPVVDEAAFTVVLEDLRAQFRVFGEALQELPTRREMHDALDQLRTELRGEMTEMRAELRGEMTEMRAELRGEMNEIRAELRGEMTEMRAELRGEIGELRTDVGFVKAAVLDLSKRIP